MSLLDKLRRNDSSDANDPTPSDPTAPEPPPQREGATLTPAPSAQTRVQRTLVFATLGALGAGLLAWYYTSAFQSVERERLKAATPAATKASTESVLPPIDFNKATAPPPAPVPTPEPRYRIGSILDADLPPSASTSGPGGVELYTPASYGTPPTKTPQQLREERLLAGEVFTRAAEQPIPTPDPLDSPPPTTGQGATDTQDPASISPLLNSTPPAIARATVLPTQRLLLPKGAFIECTLQTALDSTLPGLTTCLTAVDTFSADGNVVLLERGTRLIGETRGQVAQGAARLFVLWTEARTPKGVIVPLNSPGTDELGRSGLPGEVNRHFWQRFGAAILVSVIDGAVQSIAASQAPEGSTLVVNNSTTSDVMTEVLRSTINIPPTLRKAQGDRIQILVARDLDFRSVYTLTSRQR